VKGVLGRRETAGEERFDRVGRPPGRMDPAAYVLRDFSAAERKDLPLEIDRCANAVEFLVSKGLTAAQNAFHIDPS